MFYMTHCNKQDYMKSYCLAYNYFQLNNGMEMLFQINPKIVTIKYGWPKQIKLRNFAINKH